MRAAETAGEYPMPPTVRPLPRHAREIFRSAFNAAWRSYADRGPRAQEEIAYRVAWAAVKRRYRKIGDFWIEKIGPESLSPIVVKATALTWISAGAP